ncbi:MAG: hypothetical protein GY771_03940 [bacterium]|nr:hypothetical protein [bacterium]
MKYVSYGLVIAAGVLTVIALTYWRPEQPEPNQSFLPISPNADDFIERDVKLYGKDEEEPVAVYRATFIPPGRDSDGDYFVNLLDGGRRELTRRFTVLYLRPAKMEEGHLVIFASVYLEDGEGRRERSAPAVETGLPAFDPLIGVGYLAFDCRRMQGDLELVITYSVDPGTADAYGPAFARLTLQESV